MEIRHIDSDNFDKFVDNKDNKTVLVDFFATWCGPCRMLTPVLEEVIDEVGESVEIAKLDIDESYDLAKKFGVMSVPTMIVFKDGKEVDRIVGLRQKSQIVEVLKKY